MSKDERWNTKFGGEYSKPVSLEKAEDLIIEIQDQVANLIASAIDAGSERDAVNEDEDLELALRNLVNGWIEVR